MNTNKVIDVVVVDDDFMIANMHGKFINQHAGFQWVGTAHNYAQAVKLVEENHPDLLILDVYMPDRSGIDLLRMLRSSGQRCDVILITAAKELEIVEEGFRLGVYDYLIKPFDLAHLKESLDKYYQFKHQLTASKEVDQQTVDHLRKLRAPSIHAASIALQKGIDQRTLDRVVQCITEQTEFRTSEQIAQLAGVSRSTVRTYLTFLVEEGSVEEHQQYGTVGRPQRWFRKKSKL
ncbi:two-component system, CitB family, response regulator [Paenibacillus sp. 1_12]|uniref:response regulator n=1 Tax=Paenibacillus sp. 1_12 TaxID=1566278 RepID=UPI0008E6BC7F|nr:response regulator [Paenibacillus sp. 1_12]SFK73492.1 two-component system, CitB family, response regulator [Paenibacillus sp. 1_12]